jgi:VCBS repeat-containing protein
LQLNSGAVVTLNLDGTVSYDPSGAFDALENGQSQTDVFSYTVSDGQGGEASANAAVTVNGVSPVLVATDMVIDFEGASGSYLGEGDLVFASIDAGAGFDGTSGFSGSDGAFTIVTGGEDFDLNSIDVQSENGRTRVYVEAYKDGVLVGSTQINASSRKASSATFDTTFDGVDEVRFTGNGSFVVDNIGVTTYEVSDPNANQAPVLADDSFALQEGDITFGDLFADNGAGVDSDPEGDALTLVSINGDEDGQVVLDSGVVVDFNADGTFTYDASNAFAELFDGETAQDSFVYAVTDGQGNTSTARATFDIAGVGTPPPAPTTVDIDFESGLSEDGFAFEGVIGGQGATSGSQALQSVDGQVTFTREDGGDFDFETGVFTAFGKGRADLTFSFYDDGVLTDMQTFSVRTGKAETINLSEDMFVGADEIVVSGSTDFAVDDLLFSV